MCSMGLSLVVLAAGFGSRYGGLKQLDGFGPNQEPIILYSVYDALHAGFDHVVFVIREDFVDQFKQNVGSHVEKSIRVSYVFQKKDANVSELYQHLLADREKPWGTAHATLVAKEVVEQPFAVINADDFYGRDAFVKIAAYLRTITPAQIGMVGYILKNTVSPYGSINRGVCEVAEGKLLSIVERLKIIADTEGVYHDMMGNKIHPFSPVSMNFWGFHPSFFGYLESYFEEFLKESRGQGEYFIPLVVDKCLHSHCMSCDVMMSTDQWCGISYQEDKPFVQQTIAALHNRSVYPVHLFP